MALKRTLLVVASAMALGVVIMFLPIIAFAPFSVTWEGSQGAISQENGFKATERAFNALDETARQCGLSDVGPMPFPTSLLPAALIVALGFFLAIGFSLYFKRRIK